MKLKAIRAQNVGVLKAATALDGLTGRLDVIAAPNEAGKSTLFRAVTLALSASFSSKSGDIRQLQSAGGGAPLIEIDFETADGAWRLSKRYLSKATARLTPLAGGLAFDNADAEEKLRALIGHDLGDHGFRPLLWVAQESSTLAAQLSSAAAGSFKSQLAAEISNATGSALADRVRARVRKRLDELVTKTQKSKAGGDLDREEKAAATAEDAHKAAVALAAEVAGLRAELAALKASEAALTDPEQAAARTLRLETARRQTADAETTRTAQAAAEAAFRSAEERHARAAQEQRRLQDRLTRLDAATARIAQHTPELDSTAAALADAVARHKTAGLALANARLAEQFRQRLAIATRLAAATTAAAKAAAADTAARSSAIDAKATPKARELQRALDTLDTEISASAATVALALTPEGLARLRIDDRAPASPSETVAVDRPIVITIAGIGTVTIAPGGGSARDELLAQRARVSADLAARLASLNVTSLAEAEARLAAFAAHVQARRDAEVELAAVLAGETRLKLEAQLARLDASLGASSGPDAGAEPDLDHAQAEHAAATAALDLTRATHQIATRANDETAAEAKLLAAELPAPAERQSDLAALSAALASADLARKSAAVELGAMRERSLSREAAARLAAELTSADAAVRDARQQIVRIQQSMAGINGQLIQHEQSNGSGAAGDVADLAAHAERAIRARDRIRDEVAALRLLDQEFAIAEAQDQTEVVAPIAARLAPHLTRVFADARVDWNAELGVTTLARGEATFPFDRLSTGTREQLSVLVRLAFAELLAERGRPLPVILDDALVYSDDARRERMFEALARTARHTQVIVLTCQPAFARDLAARHGAASHVMQPWQVDALVSAA